MNKHIENTMSPHFPKDSGFDVVVSHYPESKRLRDISEMDAICLDSLVRAYETEAKPRLSSPVLSAGSLLTDKAFLMSTIAQVSNQQFLHPSQLDNPRNLYARRFQKYQENIARLTTVYEKQTSAFVSSLSDFRGICAHYLKLHDGDSTAEQQRDLSDTDISALRTALQNVEAASASADNAFRNLVSAGNNLTIGLVNNSHVCEIHKTALAQFIELMIDFVKSVSNSASSSLKSQGQLVKLVNETRLEEYRVKAKEVDAKNKQAKIINKALSIIGAIFGGLLALFSLAAAIPTGGASVAATMGFVVAASFAAVFVVDTILTFTVNFSFVGKAFEYITLGISKVLDCTLTALVVKIAKESGASKKEQQDLKKYFSMVASNIILIGLVIAPTLLLGTGGSAGKHVAKAVGENVAKGVAEESAENIALQATQNASREITENIARQSAENITKTAQENLQTVVSEISNTTSQALSKLSRIKSAAWVAAGISSCLESLLSGGLSNVSGFMTNEYFDALSKLGLNQQDIQLLKQMRRDQSLQAAACNKVCTEMQEAICDVLQDRYDALKTGYHNTERLGKI